MYSGNFGRAHTYEEILALARELRPFGIALAFSVRGNRVEELKSALQPEDINITFVDFAPQDKLEQRLGAADIHVVSLRHEYTGTVVPSKFQGALAAGRPILFSGDPDSAIGHWIREHGIGWVLTKENIREIAQDLLKLNTDPILTMDMRERCHRVYGRYFSKQSVIARMHRALWLEGTSD